MLSIMTGVGGTWEVVFVKREYFETAVKQYNNVKLDGEPLKLEIVGTNLAIPDPNPQPRNLAVGNVVGSAVR